MSSQKCIKRIRGGEYVYRKRIPEALTAVNSSKEIRVRLYTNYEKDAILRGEAVSAVVEEIIRFGKTSENKKLFVSNESHGNHMFDLIASIKILDTEVTLKCAKGNEENLIKVVNKLAASTTEVQEISSQKKNGIWLKSDSQVLDVWLSYATNASNKSSFNVYMRLLFQDSTFADITDEKAFEIRDLLPKLPELRSNYEWYRETPELSAITDDLQKLSKSRVERLSKAIVTFFKWAVGEGYIKDNPFARFNIKKTKPKNIIAYRYEEIQKIFTDEVFNDMNSDSDTLYWAPIISLYSGARLHEVAQLEMSDIIKDKNGNYYMNINQKPTVSGHAKKVKNEHAPRIVPISKRVLELGFDRYLETVRSEGHEVVFPDIGYDSENYTHSKIISGRFSHRKNRNWAFVTDPDNKNFHSLRHTFITMLQHTNVPLPLIQQLVGHAYGTITFDIYGEPIHHEKLVEVVNNVDFNLKLSPWKNRRCMKEKRDEFKGNPYLRKRVSGKKKAIQMPKNFFSRPLAQRNRFKPW